MHAPRETDLIRALLQYLTLRGIFAWRANSGAMRVGKRFVRFNGAEGCADILGLLPGSGIFLAIEGKLLGNRPTAKQQQFLDAVRRQGGVALVVTSVAELEEKLEEVLHA